MKKAAPFIILAITAAAAGFLYLRNRSTEEEEEEAAEAAQEAQNELGGLGISAAGANAAAALDKLFGFVDGRYAASKEKEREDAQFERRVQSNWHKVTDPATGAKYGIGDFYNKLMKPQLYPAMIQELEEYKERTRKTKTQRVPGIDSCPDKKNRSARERCRRVKDRYISVTNTMLGDVNAARAMAEQNELI